MMRLLVVRIVVESGATRILPIITTKRNQQMEAWGRRTWKGRRGVS